MDKQVSITLKASLAERTVAQYGSAAGQFPLFGIWVCGAEVFLPANVWVLCRYLFS